MRHRLKHILLAGATTLVACISHLNTEAKVPEKPNFIVILCDDLGYNDLECYNAPRIKTPRIDKMASEGIKFTDFYAQAVCGPSRAALLTGSYPIRIAEKGNVKNLHTELHPKELTIAEILKQQGYTSACIGKWHAGTDNDQLPLSQGFDYFYGTPMFNGYTKYIEQAPEFRAQIIRNHDTVMTVNTVDEMGLLTKNYTEEAVKFVEENKNKPFFLYLAHNMPHVPIGASPAFKGKSEDGLYGDVIEELDWSVGKVLDKLKELGLDEKTLVIFTSDNGPWIEDVINDHAGSAFPLKGAKMKTWEGGCRVPCIMRWPGVISSGQTCHEIAVTMDFLPTFAALANAKIPADLTLDGRDFMPLLTGKKEYTQEVYYYYAYTQLQAVRNRDWKLVLPRPARPKYMGWWARMIEEVPEVKLFNIRNDKEEKYNVAEQYPEIVAQMMQLVEKGRSELGDKDRIGSGARFFDNAPKDARITKYNDWASTQKNF